MWADTSSLPARQQNLKENFPILSDELVSGAGGKVCTVKLQTNFWNFCW